MTPLARALVGRWELVSFERRGDDGRVTRPFGDAPRGLLIYTEDGAMAAQLSRSGRKTLGDGPARTADPAALREAFEGYVAYFGRFEVDEEARVVVHTVTSSLLPDWEANELRRNVKLDGDMLELSTPPFRSGERLTVSVLRWRRSGS